MVKQKVAFRVDATKQIGFGHFMRTLSFAQLCVARGHHCVFLSAELPAELVDRLKLKNMDFRRIDVAMGSQQDREVTQRLLKQENINTVVFDGYHFGTTYYKQFDDKMTKIIIDDFGQVRQDNAYIINQNPWSSEIHYSTPARCFLGLEYVLLRDEFWCFKQYPKKTNKKMHLLLAMGGTDPHQTSTMMFTWLNHNITAPIKISVICNNENLTRRMREEKSIHDIVFYAQVLDMATLMANVDIALTGAGSICWELAFMRIPSFAIIQAENQVQVAAHVERNKIGFNLGWYHQIDFEKLRFNLEQMLIKPQMFNTMIENCMQLNVASKTKNICEMISM